MLIYYNGVPVVKCDTQKAFLKSGYYMTHSNERGILISYSLYYDSNVLNELSLASQPGYASLGQSVSTRIKRGTFSQLSVIQMAVVTSLTARVFSSVPRHHSIYRTHSNPCALLPRSLNLERTAVVRSTKAARMDLCAMIPPLKDSTLVRIVACLALPSLLHPAPNWIVMALRNVYWKPPTHFKQN